jgi:hypothetical protein
MPPDYYTVANVPSDWTQQKEQDHISKAEKKIKKVMEESKKSSSKEDYSPREQFEYAYPYHCVKSGQRWARENVQAWYDHRRRCDHCSQFMEQTTQQKEDTLEAIGRINYIFHEIESAKLDKELAEAQLDNKKRYNLEELPPTKYIQLDIDNTQARLNKALKDKHLLLNHENETYRKAADEIHQKYNNMTPKQKRDRYVHGVTI